jgi:hypothetical protein
MGEKRNAYRLVVGKPEGRRLLWARGSVVVKAFGYKPESRWFETR